MSLLILCKILFRLGSWFCPLVHFSLTALTTPSLGNENFKDLVWLHVTETLRSSPWCKYQDQKRGAERKNRRALGDFGNLVTVCGVDRKVIPQVSRPVTRSFCAQILANAQAEKNMVCFLTCQMIWMKSLSEQARRLVKG